jgi:hypothetical protein
LLAARHSSKKSREARAKAKLERIKPLIDASKYKTAHHAAQGHPQLPQQSGGLGTVYHCRLA